MAAPKPSAREVSANGVDFTVLEAGSGPLALCLHGFPDSAHSWRHLLPALAEAGFHAVAPFMRGYAPTAVPEDGCFSLGALVADANALHEALAADDQAVLIGADWGAEAAYGAAAFAPERWRRLVTLAIPPLTMDARLFTDFDQLRRFFYMFLFTQPLAEELVAADEMAFLDRLWEDWSPGYGAAEDLALVKDSLREQEPTCRPRSATTAPPSVLRRSPARTSRRSSERWPRRRRSRPCICMEPATAASASISSGTPRRSSRPAHASRSSRAPGTSSTWRSPTRSMPRSWAGSDISSERGRLPAPVADRRSRAFCRLFRS